MNEEAQPLVHVGWPHLNLPGNQWQARCSRGAKSVPLRACYSEFAPRYTVLAGNGRLKKGTVLQKGKVSKKWAPLLQQWAA